MDFVKTALNEDVKAIVGAFENEDFHIMNILSNRLLSNSIIVDVNDYVTGWIYKDIALSFNRFQTQGLETYSTALATVKPIINKIAEDYSSEKTNFENLWKNYFEYCLRIREFSLKSFEYESYSTNVEYTKHAFNWLINFLDENRELLKKDKNRLLKGVLNEMDRIYRCYSGDFNTLIILSLVRALDSLYLYILYEKEHKDKIYPLLDKVIKYSQNSETDIEAGSEILKDILTEWRYYFIRYMDIAVTRGNIEGGIMIPENVKGKLSDSISKSLEEEIEDEE